MPNYDPATAPLGALLTGRELAHVMRECANIYDRDVMPTRSDYNVALREIAARLYPGKVTP